MCGVGGFGGAAGAKWSRHQNLAFVKLLETVAGPSETARFKGRRYPMRLKEASRTNLSCAVLLALALMVPADAFAQSSGNGLSDLFGNIFSGPKAAGPAASAPGADGAPPPWSGEDGASGH